MCVVSLITQAHCSQHKNQANSLPFQHSSERTTQQQDAVPFNTISTDGLPLYMRQYDEFLLHCTLAPTDHHFSVPEQFQKAVCCSRSFSDAYFHKVYSLMEKNIHENLSEAISNG